MVWTKEVFHSISAVIWHKKQERDQGQAAEGRKIEPSPLLLPQPHTKDPQGTTQQGVSENVTQGYAATEGSQGEKESKQDSELGRKWQQFKDDLKKGWEYFKKIWEKIGERRDPKEPPDGYSRRELWRNKETGEEIEIHRLKRNGQTPEGHPHPKTPKGW